LSPTLHQYLGRKFPRMSYRMLHSNSQSPRVVCRDIFKSDLVKRIENRNSDRGFGILYRVGISGSLEKGTRSRIKQVGYMSVYRVHRLDTGN
jgi:hypothetical protein